MEETHMANSTLTQFVKEALEKGEARGGIRTALLSAGWRANEVDEALGAYSDVAFPIAVPKPQVYLSAREAFFYLLFFILLGVVAFNLGSLLFALIDTVIQDKIEEASYLRSSLDRQIRGAVAGLIVGTPIFLWLARILLKARHDNPALQRSRIRKWLIYVSLIIAGIVLVGDAISLVYSFLNGELTWRFTLKSLVVAGLAGAIFGYFISNAERDEANGI
jgi:cellulose synthase/poly-beta-1,6-N-acetylglucosamine synthase-like glycosyltransferase